MTVSCPTGGIIWQTPALLESRVEENDVLLRVLDPDNVGEAYWPSALEVATGRWDDGVMPRWNGDPIPADRFRDRW